MTAAVDAPKARRRWPIVLAIVLVVLVGGPRRRLLHRRCRSPASTGERLVAREVRREAERARTARRSIARRHRRHHRRVPASSRSTSADRSNPCTSTPTAIAFDGTPLDVTIQANGVPTDLSKPVQHRDAAAVAFDQAGLDSLLQKNGTDADITLGDGTVSYTASQTFIGIPLSFTLTAVPSTTDDSLVFTPHLGRARRRVCLHRHLGPDRRGPGRQHRLVLHRRPDPGRGDPHRCRGLSGLRDRRLRRRSDLVIADLAQTGTCS